MVTLFGKEYYGVSVKVDRMFDSIYLDCHYDIQSGKVLRDIYKLNDNEDGVEKISWGLHMISEGKIAIVNENEEFKAVCYTMRNPKYLLQLKKLLTLSRNTI